MRIVIVDQARMRSTRLPGKVLREVLGRPLLEYQVERLRRVRRAHELVLATTTDPADDVLAAVGGDLDLPVVRGPEHDVLARYRMAAERHRADVVVRVTSDCPIIDPEVVDGLIDAFIQAAPAVDYLSNTLERSYPRGMDAEVFTMESLKRADRNATRDYEREHVTPYIYGHPETFRIVQKQLSEDLSSHRWTVDTAEDFELIRRIIEGIYPRNARFRLDDVVNFVAANPELVAINAHVKQKQLGQ